MVARSWRNISFKPPPPPQLPPANYPIISALITNLHQTDALLKHWLKAEKGNVKMINDSQFKWFALILKVFINIG
jgi:hypothetical protein